MLDAVAMVVGAVAAGFVRFGTLNERCRPGTSPTSFSLPSWCPPGWPPWPCRGLRAPPPGGGGSEEHRRVFTAAARSVAVVAVVALLLKLDVARGFVALAVPMAMVLTLAHRYASRRWLRRQPPGAVSSSG